MFYLPEDPPLLLHLPPPLHIVYVFTVYLFTQGRGGGGGKLTREKVKEAIAHKAGFKIPTGLTVSPVYKLY